MVLKINISKAYDRVNWTFLCLIMSKMSFDQKFVDLIMLCVTTIRYFMTMNDYEFGPIFLKWSFR